MEERDGPAFGRLLDKYHGRTPDAPAPVVEPLPEPPPGVPEPAKHHTLGKGQVPPATQQMGTYQQQMGMGPLLQQSLERLAHGDPLAGMRNPVSTYYGRTLETLVAEFFISGLQARNMNEPGLRRLIRHTLAEKLMAEIEPLLDIEEFAPQFDRDERCFRARLHVALRKP